MAPLSTFYMKFKNSIIKQCYEFVVCMYFKGKLQVIHDLLGRQIDLKEMN